MADTLESFPAEQGERLAQLESWIHTLDHPDLSTVRVAAGCRQVATHSLNLPGCDHVYRLDLRLPSGERHGVCWDFIRSESFDSASVAFMRRSVWSFGELQTEECWDWWHDTHTTRDWTTGRQQETRYMTRWCRVAGRCSAQLTSAWKITTESTWRGQQCDTLSWSEPGSVPDKAELIDEWSDAWVILAEHLSLLTELEYDYDYDPSP